jgi:CDP-diacylglycerol--serine O-phosphatidyltransferase
VIVLLPVYLVFAGLLAPGRPLAFVATVFTVVVAFLLVSRLPVFSGKTIRVPRDRVLPIILGVVLLVLLLFTYPWQTLTASVLAYLVFLPLSARAYARRARMEAASGSDNPA